MADQQVALNKKVPDIKLLLTGDKETHLSDYAGKNIVIYFYPKASTPGCTQEGLDFKEAINKFRRQSCVILGASRDSLKAQEKFKTKQEFPFELISDTEEALCNLFGVMKMKNMYGKQVRGIERSTFIIDKKGKLHHEWRGVKVKGHVDEVLEVVKQLNKQ
ncbi:peroxiredoxin [Solemya velum gill symbiont]|uniref:thioredoxin-dependent peroxiredoxin n=1 Tax=Solemya velum gill symbiont TaxID=2340 RepID=A0A0B0H4S2_SOVGS|nr:peroxiredoxin [Solemya velum gill symbiont]KHF24140.1 peroxiredoxin [Solemya velum gill symbiont]OOY36114.1 peroxiredoxin [Solemya velum gill symbiont]OOY38180.1 peroxiredoxin [Solemya velum gill symbiont]OOY39980.1 peroxiredoxin [Solemya velum gill symbiont]OOY43984.1 peroxiredoxin [Solemya velum gill symbiont]